MPLGAYAARTFVSISAANSIHLSRVLLLEFQRRLLLVTFVFNQTLAALSDHRASLIRFFSYLFLFLALPALAASQSTAPVGAAQQRDAGPPSAAPAIDELQDRLHAAAAARDAGDPVAVGRANFLVLALAFRKLGNVRVAESAFPQAAGRMLQRLTLASPSSISTTIGPMIRSSKLPRPFSSIPKAPVLSIFRARPG